LEITEDNILYAIMLASFFMGVFACKVATRLFEVSHAARIAQSTIYRCLLMCAKIHEDIEFLLQLKQKTLIESGMASAKAFNICDVDKKTLNNWKESVVQRMIISAPPSFSFIIKFDNWREAMEQLDDLHNTNQ
jgi:hypothetical protein